MAQTSRSNPAIGGAVPTQCDPSPSRSDVELTMQLIEAGEILNIQLLDHVIIGGQSHVSMKNQGLAFDPAALSPTRPKDLST